MKANENFFDKGKEILRILINNGYEAYIIGDAVCKTILHKDFDEIDITTNATPDSLKGIFSFTKIEQEEMGKLRLYYSGYEFVLTTFRSADFKDKRNPKTMHYSKVFHEELANRDFTINAIAMSYGGKLTDAYQGYQDIQKGIVRSIGKPKIRLKENPIQILTAIRIVSELGFKIEKKTLRAMKLRFRTIESLDNISIIRELRRILHGKYYKKALKYLLITKVYKRLPLFAKDIKSMSEKRRPFSGDLFLGLVFVRHGEYLQEWEGLVMEPERLRLLVDLAITIPKAKYSDQDLFYYGLELCKKANLINHQLRKDRKRTRRIIKQYKKLNLQDARELAFSSADILQLTGNREGDYVQTLVSLMAQKVLNNELANNYDVLRDYALIELRNMEILPKVNVEIPEEIAPPYYELEEESQEEQQLVERKTYVSDVHSAVPESKLAELERKLFLHEQRLQEKEIKIKELERMALQTKLETDINNLVGQNLELLEDMKYIEKGTEKVMVSRELNELYRRIITNVDPKYRVLKQPKGNEEKNEN